MMQSLNIALRSIIRGRWYSLVSVAGLAIAIGVVLLVSLLIVHEYSFDRDFRKAGSIYRVTWVNTGTGDHFATMFNIFSQQMKLDFDEVEDVARLGVFELTLQRASSDPSMNPSPTRFENIAMVDPEFFTLFDFNFVAGGPQSLTEPLGLVMTRVGAERYFPGEDPMGQTLLLENNVTVTVTGLLDEMPRNSHFTTHYFMPVQALRTLYDGAGFLDSWSSDRFYHYVLLKEGVSVAGLERRLPAFLERHDPEWPLGSVDIKLQPLTGLHFITDMQNEMPVVDRVQNIIKAPRQASDLVLFGAGALFLILVASFNFMNLQVARSIGRGKQVGMLKVLGANRRQVVMQILLESTVLCLIAFVAALILVELSLDRFNEVLAVNLAWRDLLNPGFALLALIMIAGLGVLSGGYPAWLMTSQSPSQVMRGEFRLGQGAARVRSMLVLLQFAVSVVLIVVSLVIYAQIRYSLNVPLGFSPDDVAIVQMGRANQQHFEALKARLENDPGVSAVTRATVFPGDHLSDGFSLMKAGGRDEIAMRSVWADQGYFETLGMQIISGRSFSPEYGADEFAFPSAESPTTTSGLIINQAAARRAGWLDGDDASAAIGEVLYAEHTIDGVLMTMRFNIVGVVADVHYRSLRSEIVPMSFSLSGWGSNMAVRFLAGAEKQEAAQLLDDRWKEVVTGVPLRLTWLEDSVDELYAQEHHSLRLVSSIALLAILVASLGLFAVASLVTGLRTREIGLRKILGAGVREIVNLLSWQFLKPVLLANLVAWPLAWLYLDSWLELFAYRVDLSWVHFLVPGLVAILIAWITVAGQALRVATNNPIRALRYD